MLYEQSKVEGCEECPGHKDNPPDFLRQQVCPACPHSRKVENPYLFKLLHYFKLQNSSCPIGRHELLDQEWIDLGIVKAEWAALEIRRNEARRESNNRF